MKRDNGKEVCGAAIVSESTDKSGNDQGPTEVVMQ